MIKPEKSPLVYRSLRHPSHSGRYYSSIWSWTNCSVSVLCSKNVTTVFGPLFLHQHFLIYSPGMVVCVGVRVFCFLMPQSHADNDSDTRAFHARPLCYIFTAPPERSGANWPRLCQTLAVASDWTCLLTSEGHRFLTCPSS